MPLKRNRVLETTVKKKTQRQTNSGQTISLPCAPQIHRITGGGRVL